MLTNSSGVKTHFFYRYLHKKLVTGFLSNLLHDGAFSSLLGDLLCVVSCVQRKRNLDSEAPRTSGLTSSSGIGVFVSDGNRFRLMIELLSAYSPRFETPR